MHENNEQEPAPETGDVSIPAGEAQDTQPTESEETVTEPEQTDVPESPDAESAAQADETPVEPSSGEGLDEPKLAHADPKQILNKIESFTHDVDQTFKGIVESLGQLQVDIAQLDSLKEVAVAAEQMLSGGAASHLDVQAKGEIGKLASAINQTLENLQQLDKTVHEETGKVPELAAHLDSITEETETATQQVLEKLDEVIEGAESQNNSLSMLKEMSHARLQMDREAAAELEGFVKKLQGEGEEDPAQILEEAMDYVVLMGERSRVHLAKSEEVDRAIESAGDQAENLMNHAFDIMNLLQFQDITRQKISKVIGLLKEMQSGLYRLLEIFNINSEDDRPMELTEKQLATQDRILERDALGNDDHTANVDEIIKNFQSK